MLFESCRNKETCIFASVQYLCSPCPSADLYTLLPVQVYWYTIKDSQFTVASCKFWQKQIQNEKSIGWLWFCWEIVSWDDLQKLCGRHKIWYLLLLFEFRSAKSVLTCDYKTWVLHVGIIYISLSLPFTASFEEGPEKEHSEYIFLLCLLVFCLYPSLN